MQRQTIKEIPTLHAARLPVGSSEWSVSFTQFLREVNFSEVMCNSVSALIVWIKKINSDFQAESVVQMS